MKIKRILVCDGTIDGIFTAIYRAYDMRYGHENIKITEESKEGSFQDMELFSEYHSIETDYEISAKVASSVKEKISYEAYEHIVRAALSSANGRSDIIYRFVILGFHIGKNITSYLGNDVVDQIFRLNRYVGSETHRMLEFLRFKEVGDGILLAIVKPVNNVVALIAPHFADRLNNENFIIFDEGREIAAIHAKNSEIIMTDMKEDVIGELNRRKSEEEDYESLWKSFFHSISIKERENYKLQRNMLPLRYRSNMTEFQ